MRARFLALAVGLMVALNCTPVYPHGEWAWIQKYNNNVGYNCCTKLDATVVPHEVANSAQVGSVIMADFPVGPTPVTVNKIYPTEDPRGRAWITKYGCLFRWSGG